jgi:hypothetical protein
VTSVAYLSDDIITNDVMTHRTRLGLRYVYKGHWEDVYSPVPTSCTSIDSHLESLVIGLPILAPGYPCVLKGTYLYLRDLYL